MLHIKWIELKLVGAKPFGVVDPGGRQSILGAFKDVNVFYHVEQTPVIKGTSIS
jgi:hypothetical protein